MINHTKHSHMLWDFSHANKCTAQWLETSSCNGAHGINHSHDRCNEAKKNHVCVTAWNRVSRVWLRVQESHRLRQTYTHNHQHITRLACALWLILNYFTNSCLGQIKFPLTLKACPIHQPSKGHRFHQPDMKVSSRHNNNQGKWLSCPETH